MNEKKPFPIPVVPAGPESDPALDNCSAAESFALMVLGDSMEPEFVEGDIIVIEPEGLATDGSYVMAWLDGEWIFRQLKKAEEGWKLQPLNPKYPGASIPDLSVIKGVIIQKSKPGRRKATKRYID
ncbi:MAG: S24 family peptidase [Pseudomonadota bacterium]